MRIDDRLRDGLRAAARPAGDGAGAEHLWAGIEGGVARARRRQVTMRIAVGGLSVAVAAGAIVLVALGFRGSRPEPANPRVSLAVVHVRVFGVALGPAKVYGNVSNRGTEPSGAAITCIVLDRGGGALGSIRGSLPYLAAGASVPFGPLTGVFHTTPVSARCGAAAIPAVKPSPTPEAAARFTPLSVAFWDARRGVMAGVYGEPECFPSCTWVIDRTSDGGRTWRQVVRSAEPIYDVALIPQPLGTNCGFGCGVPVGRSSWAWALRGQCAMGTCRIDVLYSADGGGTWHERATTDFKDLSVVSGSAAWGVGNVFPIGSQRLGVTTDGGRTWSRRAVPCPQAARWAAGVSVVTAQHGWLLCTGMGGAGNENRAVLETQDGGLHWTVVAEAILGGPSSGGLTAAGYPSGIFFLADGHGWMWAQRAGLLASTDGGRSWRRAGQVANGASSSIDAVWFLSDTTGFAVRENGDAQATQLIETTDRGISWRIVHAWPK